MSPFRMKLHNQLLLLGLINMHIPTHTDFTIPPAVGYVGSASVCDGWTSLVAATAPPRRF